MISIYQAQSGLKKSLEQNTKQSYSREEFKNLLDDHGLTQLINEPTRRDNPLGVIACYVPDEVNRTKITPGISDHETPKIELSVAPTYKKQVPRQV